MLYQIIRKYFMYILIIIFILYYITTNYKIDDFKIDNGIKLAAESIAYIFIFINEKMVIYSRKTIERFIPGIMIATGKGLAKIKVPIFEDIKMPKMPDLKI